jgi:hypothetical protein
VLHYACASQPPDREALPGAPLAIAWRRVRQRPRAHPDKFPTRIADADLRQTNRMNPVWASPLDNLLHILGIVLREKVETFFQVFREKSR